MLRIQGPDVWLEEQKKSHTCKVCGNVVNPYSQECYGCGEKFSSESEEPSSIDGS